MRANWRFILWMIMGCWIGLVNAQETFTLIAEDNWYPYSSKREGKPVGLAVDVVHAAYEAAGVSVELVSRPDARCMLEVKQGKFVGCFDTSKDVLTEEDYLYHQRPLFYATFGIYARSGHAQKMTAGDLAGMKVGLTNGYTYGLLEKNTQFIRDYGPSDIRNFRKLLAKRFDYTVVYTKVADAIISENKTEFGSKIQLVGTTETIPLYISFSKAHPQSKRALELFDLGMQTIIENGRYAEIGKSWNEKLAN